MENILLNEKCPGCQEPLKQFTYNDGWHKEICKNNCPLGYEKISIDESNGYLKFELKDFYVWVYIDFMARKDQIFIYPKIPSRETLQEPQIFTIPRFEIDWNKLDYYNERWNLWKTFL